MALWQVIDSGETWDDGLTAKPGEPEFTAALVIAKAGPANFNYVGTPNWAPPADQSGEARPDTPVPDELVSVQASA